MTSFGLLKNPAAQHGPIRVSAGGPPAAAARSPLLSPRCRSPAPTHKRTLTTSGAHSTDTVQLTSSSSARRVTHPSPDSTSNSSHRRSSGFDDTYDSAVPMSVVLGWERVEEDLGLDEAPMADPQEWEEMVSLLSFDGEEHKKVTRQLHGANARVEDMFASFDGDDFEAVLRAARNELPHEPNPADSTQQPPAHGNSSASSSLYQSVCALRAAAMAAEAAKKQKGPAAKKRRAHLGEPNPADAWMLQVPYAVAGQPAQHGAAIAAAAAAGAAAGVADSSGNGSSAQDCIQQQGREASDVQQLQLQHLAYIGMSCDSSSDGSCSSSHDDLLIRSTSAVAAGAGAAAVSEGRTAQTTGSRNIVSASNNIVSSRLLGIRLAPASAVLAVAASKASHAWGAAAAGAVLEAPPMAAPAAAVLLAPTHLSSRAALLTATDEVHSVAAAQQHTLELVGGRGAAHVATGVQQQQRWSGRSTQSLRRALARLHHTLPE